MLLPITLTIAAGAAMVHIWHFVRCVRIRIARIGIIGIDDARIDLTRIRIAPVDQRRNGAYHADRAFLQSSGFHQAPPPARRNRRASWGARRRPRLPAGAGG